MIYAYLLHISALPLVLLAGIKGPTCPPGAKWSSCTGCWSYCPIMEMACAASCKEGCSCEQKGYVIHEGACIPSSECPLIPRGGDRCPLDKVWNSCSDCGAFCPVKRKCQDVCRKGCVCKKRGYVLQKGACIPFSECSTSPPHVQACPLRAVWSSCSKCDSYCLAKEGCRDVCIEGCVCKQKHFVFHEGKCIQRRKCPAILTKKK